MRTITHNEDRVSESGRQWLWCNVWKCWQYDNHRLKIYPHPEGFTCSDDSVWLDGMFESFEAAEIELCKYENKGK